MRSVPDFRQTDCLLPISPEPSSTKRPPLGSNEEGVSRYPAIDHKAFGFVPISEQLANSIRKDSFPITEVIQREGNEGKPLPLRGLRPSGCYKFPQWELRLSKCTTHRDDSCTKATGEALSVIPYKSRSPGLEGTPSSSSRRSSLQPLREREKLSQLPLPRPGN